MTDGGIDEREGGREPPCSRGTARGAKGRCRVSPDRSSCRRVPWLRVHHPSGTCWTCPDESEACHMRTPLGVSLLSLLVGAVIDRVDGQ